MGKTVEDICNLFTVKVDFDNPVVCQKKASIADAMYDFSQDFSVSNPYSDFKNINMRKLTNELAIALDNNNIDKIKELKTLYGDSKEFAQAKAFLNKKCKEVWNVYSTSYIPKEAMKALGITNQPDLDFILGNSVRHFEKDNGDTTSYIIKSTLDNKNMNYTMNDIHNYLAKMHKKEKCNYNFKTVAYLISQHDYDNNKLKELGADDITVEKSLKFLNLKTKAKFLTNNLKNTKLFEKVASLF